MKLAKDLVVEDRLIANAISIVGTRITGDRYLLFKGTPLPTGPLHPIAALAFAMAGFVLKTPTSSVLYTAPNGQWRAVWPNQNGTLEIHPGGIVAPVGASIHSHTDPTLIDNGHNG